MSERRGGIYARMDGRPNTRKANRKPRKSYVKGIPGLKIHQFGVGNQKGKFEKEYSLVVQETTQIKHNALEAARVAATKKLNTMIGANDFFMKIRKYPHHILRENAMATGAGADRFQEGMRRSFGKPIACAVRIKAGEKIISVWTMDGKELVVKEALRLAKMKFAVKCRILIEDVETEEAPVVEKKKEEPNAEVVVEEKVEEAPVEVKEEEPKPEETVEQPSEVIVEEIAE